MNTRAQRQVKVDARTTGRHAVVLGGSLAGLLAARVLSDHFEKVTLIERDAFTNTCETRRGTPQANHVHGLLVRGRQILEDLFPGLQDEIVADGAPVVDMANEIAWFTRAGWGVRFPSDLKVLAFTRPLLDLHVRRRLAGNANVEILDNTDVLRLLPGSKVNQIAGVLICPRNAGSDRRVARPLTADLVVDATGRASRAPRWLSDLGYEPPECDQALDALVSGPHCADASVQFVGSSHGSLQTTSSGSSFVSSDQTWSSIQGTSNKQASQEADSFTCRLRKRMKTRTEITLEVDRWMVVSRPGRRGRIAWCSNCSCYVEMLSIDEAALLANVNSRTIFRWAESGVLHSSETREGLLLICPRALHN